MSSTCAQCVCTEKVGEGAFLCNLDFVQKLMGDVDQGAQARLAALFPANVTPECAAIFQLAAFLGTGTDGSGRDLFVGMIGLV